MVLTPEQASQISPVFHGVWGRRLFKCLEAITGLDKVNGTHQRVEDLEVPPGPDFAKAIMDDYFHVGSQGTANGGENQVS